MPRLVTTTDRSTVEVIGRLVIRSTDDASQPSTVKVRHSFDMSVQFPHKVLKVIKPLFQRVVAEVTCEQRGWDEWAQEITEATDDPLMRSWVASIAWWDYGKDRTGNPLIDLAEPLPVDFSGCDKELVRVLRRIGYPSPEDRVKQLPVAKRRINRALARLGSPKVKVG